MCRGRFILVPLLAFGAIAGFASGFASLHHHRCAWSQGWQQPATIVQQQPAPAPQPVVVQQPAPAPQPAQTLVIPIIVGVPSGANPVQPTTIVVPTPTAAPTTASTPAATPPAAPAPGK